MSHKFQFQGPDELHKLCEAAMKRAGIKPNSREGKAQWFRQALERHAQDTMADDALDSILPQLRKVVRAELKKSEDRLADLASKAAIYSATTMELVRTILPNVNYNDDPEAIFQASRKKALAMLRTEEPTEDLAEEVSTLKTLIEHQQSQIAAALRQLQDLQQRQSELTAPDYIEGASHILNLYTDKKTMNTMAQSATTKQNHYLTVTDFADHETILDYLRRHPNITNIIIWYRETKANRDAMQSLTPYLQNYQVQPKPLR